MFSLLDGRKCSPQYTNSLKLEIVSPRPLRLAIPHGKILDRLPSPFYGQAWQKRQLMNSFAASHLR
jgi:hypothetical protein